MPLQLLNLGVVIPRVVMLLFYTRTPRGRYPEHTCSLLAHKFLDFAELNAPPMINYGVVYPQAILIFVMTLLYSVSQPLILIFGAIYFGMAYVVYKYKLMFGSLFLLPLTLNLHIFSVLQTLRVSRTGLADNFHSAHLGGHHVPDIYDRSLHPKEGIHHLYTGYSPPCRHCVVVVVHQQSVPTTKQVCQSELGLRSSERRGIGRGRALESWSPSDVVSKVRGLSLHAVSELRILQ
jgi:hypothetical protein